MKTNHRSGFTLIEVMTVITIIAIIAGIMLAGARYAQEKGAKSRTLALIHTLGVQLECYKADWNVYPRDLIDSGTWGRIRSGQPAQRQRQQRYGTGLPDPAECLWYYLSQAMPDIDKKAYMIFKPESLSDRDNDKNPEVADAFGYPLNYKSNNPESYNFTTPLKNQPNNVPRHNIGSFDLCSYGRDNTTWKTYDADPAKRTGTMYLPAEINFSGGGSTRPHNFWFVPFNNLGQLSSNPHCFGGEGDDDLNNWQQQ